MRRLRVLGDSGLPADFNDRAAAFTNGMVAVGGSTLAAYFAFPGAYGSITLSYY